ncbi:MAG: hypothetical protein K9J06_08280 [Flavobacteriales bacterium]|nr:hypothetical protein [Flavobacteriales bacterium]
MSDTVRQIPSPPPTDGSQPEPPKPSTPFAAMSGVDITMVGLDFSKARKKRFLGLISGRTYYCIYYVINANGVSQLCPAVSIQCW